MDSDSGMEALDDAALNRPNPARIYDYALGGHTHFAADRAAFEAMSDVYPDAPLAARANRAFLRRAVTFVARQGIERFLDIGSGLPTAGNVHEVAYRIHPQAHVVYVDNDPVAVGHSQHVLARDQPPHVVAIAGDLRDPEGILAQKEVRRLLRPARPVALVLLAVLPFVPADAEALRAVRTLTAALPPGSYLVLSHGTDDGVPESTLSQFIRLYERTTRPLGFRPVARMARFFAGFTLVEPGLVFVPSWRPDTPHEPPADERTGHAFVLHGRGYRGQITMIDTRTGRVLHTATISTQDSLFAGTVDAQTGRAFVISSVNDQSRLRSSPSSLQIVALSPWQMRQHRFDYAGHHSSD